MDTPKIFASVKLGNPYGAGLKGRDGRPGHSEATPCPPPTRSLKACHIDQLNAYENGGLQWIWPWPVKLSDEEVRKTC